MFIWKLRENRATTRDLEPSTFAYTHTHTHTKSPWEKNESGFREVVRAANESGRFELQEFPACIPSVVKHQRFRNEEALSLSNKICHFEWVRLNHGLK